LNTFSIELASAIRDFGLVELTSDQAKKLTEHYELMIDWNQRMNLTRITEPAAAARLHYAESIFGSRFIGPARTLLDIGSGAGFPGIPIAILRDDVAVTLLESNQKKASFLREAAAHLSLPNVAVAAERLEQFDWQTFDFLVTRALDRADRILRQAVKRLHSDQRLAVYCSMDLLNKLNSFGRRVEAHAIPWTQNRFVALFG